MKLPLLVLFFLLLCDCTTDKMTGTSDETSTGVQASVFYENGTPSADVAVQLFMADDTSKIAMQKVMTNNNGFFHIDNVSDGTYNLFTETDSLAAFVDSIKVESGSRTLDDIILRQKCKVSGIVVVQPNHSPQIVTVQALGTHRYANVDTSGFFTLSGLAEGEYSLCFKTTDNNYTPLYKTVRVTAGTDKILSDTIQMIYTGIPVVGLPDISFDTIHSVVHLEWDAVSYHNLSDYLIYRKSVTDAVWSDMFIGTTSNSEYFDTIEVTRCDEYVENDKGCINEVQYRVIARSKADEIGEPYYVASVTVVAPSILLPVADAGSDTLLAAGDTIVLQGTGSSFLGEIAEYAWDIGNTEEFIKSPSGNATFTASGEYDDTTMCIFRVANTLGNVGYDTVLIFNGVPPVEALHVEYDTANSLVRLRWNSVAYSGLKEYLIYCKLSDVPTWRLGYFTTTDTVYIDTMFFSGCSEYSENNSACSYVLDYRIAARSQSGLIGEPSPTTSIKVVSRSILLPDANAGDDIYVNVGRTVELHGNKSTIVLGEISEYAWDVGNTGEFTVSSTGDITVNAPEEYNDTTLCILRVTAANGTLSYDTVAVISAGFRLAAAELPVRPMNAVVLHDTLWSVGTNTSGGATNEIWYSTDGITWEMVPPSLRFSPRSGHSAVVFHDTVWVIGGFTSDEQSNDVWCSVNMKDWELVAGTSPFHGRTGHSTMVFKDTMWLIGGYYRETVEGENTATVLNDVWCSADGKAWLQVTEQAAFSKRYGAAAVAFNGKMWIIGGRQIYMMGSYNDVWCSDDGENWLSAGSVGSSNWSGYDAVVFKDRMWLVSDPNTSVANQINEVMATEDGLLWKYIIDIAPFSTKTGHTVTVYKDKLWVLGGAITNGQNNDAWYLE